MVDGLSFFPFQVKGTPQWQDVLPLYGIAMLIEHHQTTEKYHKIVIDSYPILDSICISHS